MQAHLEKEVIPVVEGRREATGDTGSHQRPMREGEMVYVLTDLVEGPVFPPDIPPLMKEQILKVISETTERIVRDVAPGIVERVIREEIEKLKRDDD